MVKYPNKWENIAVPWPERARVMGWLSVGPETNNCRGGPAATGCGLQCRDSASAAGRPLLPICCFMLCLSWASPN